ncbi:MAG: cupin domain-containing protein [Pseudomonadota bacterium]
MTSNPLVRAGEIQDGAFAFRHPLDPSAGCRITPVSRLTGLGSAAINIVRIASGERAFPLHRHQGEEEWTYVVEGAGKVQLDDEMHDIAAGDFVAFAPGGAAHAVMNTGAAEMICLMGGDMPTADVIDFPELVKRVVRDAQGFAAASSESFEKIFPAPRGETE